jgi:hypothetical protein
LRVRLNSNCYCLLSARQPPCHGMTVVAQHHSARC